MSEHPAAQIILTSGESFAILSPPDRKENIWTSFDSLKRAKIYFSVWAAGKLEIPSIRWKLFGILFWHDLIYFFINLPRRIFAFVFWHRGKEEKSRSNFFLFPFGCVNCEMAFYANTRETGGGRWRRSSKVGRISRPKMKVRKSADFSLFIIAQLLSIVTLSAREKGWWARIRFMATWNRKVKSSVELVYDFEMLLRKQKRKVWALMSIPGSYLLLKHIILWLYYALFRAIKVSPGDEKICFEQHNRLNEKSSEQLNSIKNILKPHYDRLKQ